MESNQFEQICKEPNECEISHGYIVQETEELRCVLGDVVSLPIMIQDFKDQNFLQFYDATNSRRCFAFRFDPKKNFEKDIRKTGKLAGKKLTELKIDKIDFVFSPKINTELYGHFENSFLQYNYAPDFKQKTECNTVDSYKLRPAFDDKNFQYRL